MDVKPPQTPPFHDSSVVSTLGEGRSTQVETISTDPLLPIASTSRVTLVTALHTPADSSAPNTIPQTSTVDTTASSWTPDDVSASRLNQSEHTTEEPADAARELIMSFFERELRSYPGDPTPSLGPGRPEELPPWGPIHDLALEIQTGSISNGRAEKKKAGEVLATRLRRRLQYLKEIM
jgi:hypothetical protein